MEEFPLLCSLASLGHASLGPLTRAWSPPFGRWCWTTWNTARKIWRKNFRRPLRWMWEPLANLVQLQWDFFTASHLTEPQRYTVRAQHSAVLHRKRVWPWRRTPVWRVVYRRPRPRWGSGRSAALSRTTRRSSSCWRPKSGTWRTSWPARGKQEGWRPPRWVWALCLCTSCSEQVLRKLHIFYVY